MVVVWWCQHPARELVLVGVSQDCGGVGVLVFLWWCQHPARELVLFGVLQDCGDVVVRWCGGAVEMCICVRCVMCDNSHQELADDKDVLVRGITTL